MKSICLLTVAIFMTFSLILKSQTILEYERTTFSGSYQEITGASGPQGEYYAENYGLPFTFHYIDHDYNLVRISTSGWIELGSSTRPLSYSNSPYNEDLFSGYEPNKTIAPWWDYLGAYNYPVQYTTLGSAPNRVFVVQWKNVNSPSYSYRTLNFQVRLYETTNLIEFWYGNTSGSGELEYASFGIEDHIGGSGHFIDGPTGSNTIGTTDLNSYSNWPSAFYRFSPAPVKVVKPNGGEHFSIGYQDTIKWTATVSNVKLEYSTNSGNNWDLIVNSIPASSGHYIWTIPIAPSENSLVKISDASNPAVFDISDNVFSISEPPLISVLPDSISLSINEGDSSELSLQISNSGTGNLYYGISIENIYLQSKKELKISSGSPFSDWKENFRKAKEKRVKGTDKPALPAVFPEETLPLVISDPAGDGGAIDIIEIRGISSSDSVEIQLVFETELNVYDLGGIIGFDTDQDVLTGIPLENGLISQTVGCEYFASLYDIGYNEIYVFDQYYNWVGYFPAQYDSHNIRFSIPLSAFGNDDGVINLAGVVGNSYGPTDWIPDEGCGVLGGNLWLNVNPLSGIINPGSIEDVQLKISTEYINGGEFYANLLISSNDPVNQLVTVPVHLTVIGQPDLVAPDSSLFSEVFVGFPITNYLNLKNNGSVNLEVSDIESSNNVFTCEGNSAFTISPASSYQLPVIFNPATAGSESGTLNIVSNDPSSPFIINLTGEGVFPPSITVTPDSFFFDLNVGDSLNTQFIIDNSNGLGDLTFSISDMFIADKMVKRNPHQDFLRLKKPGGDKHKVFEIDPRNIPNSLNKKNTQNPQKKSADDPLLILPVLIQDNLGDGGEADIKEIRGQILNNNLEIEYVFADGVDIYDYVWAVLFLDVDRNPLTGETDPYFFHDLGVDYEILCIYPYLGPQIQIYEYSTGNYFLLPCNFSGTIVSYSIPLSLFGDDDGNMDLLALSQDVNSMLDWAPDESHVTLYADVPWLNENPLSGTIPAGGSVIVEVEANTSELFGGNFLASIDIQSNDPVHPVIQIPFRLHLTGVPNLIASPDSIDFGETYIGYSNSLSISISSTGTDSLIGSLVSSGPQFILIDSVFNLPVGAIKNIEVKFQPVDPGFSSATITINSNGGSKTIYLSGMGLIAPNIITSATSMQFVSNSGDTLHSGFTIYNTGGSNLNVQIDDEMFLGSAQRLFACGNNMIYEINIDNGAILNSFSSPVYTSYYYNGLAFSGDKLFISSPDYSSNIFVLNPENGTIISAFPSNSGYCTGLAYIEPYLYAYDSYSYGINILNPENGNVIRTIYPPVYLYGDIDGGNGRLFASDSYTIFELNINNGSILNSFYAANAAYGMGFTGTSLFTTVTWAGTDEYNPDTGEFKRTISTTGYSGLAGAENRDAEWLIASPGQVNIAAGDSTYISLNICASDTGHHSAHIILESNDPDASMITIPVVLDVLTGIDNENTLPTEYSLYYNYPNPFNPSTTIKYDLPRQSNVTLKIYDILGEEVATLVNTEQMAGRYKIQWNADRFASGIYIYRIQASDFVAVKKMILVK